MLVDFAVSQVIGGALPSPTPVPFCPRKEGQFCEDATDEKPRQSATAIKDFMTLLALLFLLFLDVLFSEIELPTLTAHPDLVSLLYCLV